MVGYTHNNKSLKPLFAIYEKTKNIYKMLDKQFISKETFLYDFDDLNYKYSNFLRNFSLNEPTGITLFKNKIFCDTNSLNIKYIIKFILSDKYYIFNNNRSYE